MVTKGGGREGGREDDRKEEQPLPPLEMVALCWAPCCLARLFIALPQPSLPPVLSLETGQKQKIFSGLF